jgi:hypothetical protein
MHRSEFEPAIPASERQQIPTFTRAATGIGAALGLRGVMFQQQVAEVRMLSRRIGTAI